MIANKQVSTEILTLSKIKEAMEPTPFGNAL